jgi:uncharacterized protein YdaU (DUF1376 family)
MSVDIDDHALECIGLSWEARGAFDAVLTETWRRGARFPDDDEKIAHGIGMHLRTWRRIRPELEPLFDLSDGTWRHHLIDRARAHAERHAKQVSPEQLNLNFTKSLKTSDLPRHKKKPIEPRIGSIGSTAVPENAYTDPPTARPSVSRERRRKGSATSCKTLIDPAWTPSAADISFAHQRGYNDAWIERQADRFGHYYRARGSQSFSWHETWCCWVVRAPEFERAHRRTGDVRDYETGASIYRVFSARRERQANG